MDSPQDHTNSPGGGKSHVCTKCGWSYPNPHPSAKNRRAHKKICGTIKGFEIFDPDKAKQDLDLKQEQCLDDEQKTPSPIFDSKTANQNLDLKQEHCLDDEQKTPSPIFDSGKANQNLDLKQEHCLDDEQRTISPIFDSEKANQNLDLKHEHCLDDEQNNPSPRGCGTIKGFEISDSEKAKQDLDLKQDHCLDDKQRTPSPRVCGTIKGIEIFGSEKANQNLDLKQEHCLDDEQKTPSPRVLDNSDERIGDTSEEDVFTDAVSEFSRSDSFKEETAAINCAAKGETQQFNNSSIDCVMKSSEVVQQSCEVPPVEVLKNHDAPGVVEAASDNRQGVESFTKEHSISSETVIELPQEAQVADCGDSMSNAGLVTECKEKLTEESESKVASALGEREDISDSSWNDDVIYSDVEGPYGISSEAMSMTNPGEASCIVSEDVPDHTSLDKADAVHVISSASQSVSDEKPFVENANVSLHGIKGVEEFEASHDLNLYLPEQSKGEKCETNTLTETDDLGIQSEGLSIGTEVASSDKLLVGDKTEPENQTDLVAVTEFSKAENIKISKIDSEESESSLGNVQTVTSETLRVSLLAVDSTVGDTNADVSSAAKKTCFVDESELIQANAVAEEVNNPKDTPSSESSCYISPVSVVFEGDDANDQIKSSTETPKDSALQTSACESIDEVCREINNERLVEERTFLTETTTAGYPTSRSESIGIAPDDTVEPPNQKSLESERTEFNRVVGGLGVIQANEIDSNVKAHDYYAEVPVTIESNDHRDLGRLQNISEAHIRSLVLSPLVPRNHSSNQFESNIGSISGGENKPENQEITLEKTTSWRTSKEQHVPLKNLLSEARSPRVQQEAKSHNNIPKVRAILGQDTSPEDDSRWPERREVSQEWNSPAKYPVDLKREERKVKGRPFWVPFVCCSNVK